MTAHAREPCWELLLICLFLFSILTEAIHTGQMSLFGALFPRCLCFHTDLHGSLDKNFNQRVSIHRLGAS